MRSELRNSFLGSFIQNSEVLILAVILLAEKDELQYQVPKMLGKEIPCE